MIIRSHRPWSVGVQLAAAVAVVVVLFAGVGMWFGNRTLKSDRAAVASDLQFQAGLATTALAASLAQAGVTAAQQAAQLVPGTCGVQFQAVNYFAGGHVDLLAPDGRIVCSSDPHAVGNTYPGALSSVAGAVLSTPFLDQVTGQRAVAALAPLRNEAGFLAIVAPLTDTATALVRTFGGPLAYDFVVTDRAGSTVLSSSRPTSGSVNPIFAAHMVSGSASVFGPGWQVIAGVSPGRALASTRSLFRQEIELSIAAVGMILFLLGLVNRRIARPLRQLTSAVAQAGRQVDPEQVSVRGPREVSHLADEFNAMIESRHNYERTLTHQALHDPLTGLPNRALLLDRMAHALAKRSDDGASVGVFFIDVDRFKLVNDSMGHEAGDGVLMELAMRLAAAIRPEDTLARFGGDEFVVLCEGVTTSRDAEEVCRRIERAMNEPFTATGGVITLSVSVGVALAGPRSIPEELLRDADTAMYRAKELGRDRHHVFDDALHAEVTTRLTLENDLRTALARGELRVVYQPVIDLASGVTSGVEALLRWDHPVRGPIPPLQFIPLAEETGTILPIGRFVLQEACRQAVAWHEAGWPIQVAVNVSAYQIHNDGFVDDVATALERSGLESSFLCLELTETTLMTESTHTVHMLESLKRLGVRISIDDFGTGYSSLAYLQQFPVDEVKIDRAFVSNLPGPSEELTLVGAMVAMGQALRLNVVAEGVEQPAQVDELRRLGCDSAQGFLFAVPQSAEAVTYLLRRQNLRAVS